MMMPTNLSEKQLEQLVTDIRHWSGVLGFQQTGITDTNLQDAESHLQRWLEKEYHGEMHFMQKHGDMRTRPEQLVPGTLTLISVRMDYWPEPEFDVTALLHNPAQAYVSRYALGRDYHKIMRKRLQHLADKISAAIGEFGYRVFVDSAPVMERAIAEKAGLGWIGKHTNLINESAGSWFFLGEIYTDLPLPIDDKASEHCGTCSACIDACPTDAIVAPYELDARRCISYLTIEHKSAIPVELRPLLGNRIYGCDDCQVVCPWNRFANMSAEEDFKPRHNLGAATLLQLFAWTEAEFLDNTEGSAIRRIGYESWSRNIAVALGNADPDPVIVNALQQRLENASPLVREHIEWALERQQA